jgi:hypothetical protein
MIQTFYKEENRWFIHLPEFIEKGLGTRENLAMVAGSDTLLDALCTDNKSVKLLISTSMFEAAQHLKITSKGADVNVLEAYGHPIQMGAFYVDVKSNHEIWLCPVAEYVFNGNYPDNIYYKVL